jgi:site-specific recombinase XerD
MLSLAENPLLLAAPAELVPIPDTDVPVISANLTVAIRDAERYAAMATVPNTERAFRSDWNHFEAWCATENLIAYPANPSTVAVYIASLAGSHKVSTLQRRLTAINYYHRQHGDDRPCGPASMKHATIASVMRGLKREKGTRAEPKAALTTDQVRAMVRGLPESLCGLRDRALLLIGFAGGFRRSELAALDFRDVEDGEGGLKILIRRSKADQEGEGRKLGIPFGSDPRTCPVRAYRKWIAAAVITEGPIFRHFHNQKMGGCGITPQVVALIVKKAAECVGLETTELSGHSLRSGLATTAARNGASERSIMRQTGHRSVAMVRRYIREAELFHDNAATKLGL